MKRIYRNYSPTFLYADKYMFPPEWVNDAPHVPYSMLRYIVSGKAKFTVDEKSYVVQKGDVFYIPQGCHLYCTGIEGLVFISIRFIGSIQLENTDMLKILWNVRQRYCFGEDHEIRDWFEHIYSCAISGNSYKRLQTRGYLNLICARLAEESSERTVMFEKPQVDKEMSESIDDLEYLRKRAMASCHKIDPRIQILVDYINLHPETNLSREEMCHMCNVSESTLRRLFRAYTGKNIYDYTKETKVLYAAKLLMTTDLSVSEVGYRLGYESASYFTKTFKEVFGVSPRGYRNCSEEA